MKLRHLAPLCIGTFLAGLMFAVLLVRVLG